MEFEAFMTEAWTEHAERAEIVAERLSTSTSMIREIDQIPGFAQLTAHVFGEHLGQWQRGLELLEALTRLPCFASKTEAERTIVRLRAALGVASGALGPELYTLDISERVRALSVAAAALTGRAETERAASLFSRVLELATCIADDDPATRALAVMSNNLAAELEQKAERSPAERELMLLAAHTARRRWELAGTWLNIERAEYRLARSCLAAGELAAAFEHAQACLEICRAHDAEPRELFWGFECLAHVARARLDAPACAAALAAATAILPELPDAIRGECARSLEPLTRVS